MMNSIKTLYQTSKNDALYAYIWFLEHYSYHEKLTQYAPFQIDDMILAINNPRVLLLRTRRGGKSRDESVMAVFWTIVGLNAIYYTYSKDQKSQLKKWFSYNPFVRETVSNEVLNSWGFELFGTLSLSRLERNGKA